MSKTPEKQPGDPKTTGHSWDGIEEFDNPMPRWWLWTFYATIVWGVIYTILYPAWPLVQSATAGVLGWYGRKPQIAKAVCLPGPQAAKGLQAESRCPARFVSRHPHRRFRAQPP